MKLKLKHINAIEVAHFMALLYIPFGLIYVAIGAVSIIFGEIESGIILLITGIVMPLLSWPFIWIGTLIANLALKITKGITLTVDKAE